MKDSPVRTVPFPRATIFGEEEKKAVLEVLESGILSGFIAAPGENFLGGPKVKELESEGCRYFDVKYCMAVNSATAGLHAALAACGVGPGDEVIVPPYTMSASAAAILMQSAVPVFSDIEDKTFGLDPLQIEKNITPRTRAIVVVHLFGHSADMDPIMAIALRHNLKVIEDCAQSPGAKYKGRYVGTIGNAGVFSFNQHKTITTGEGGLVVTQDEVIALKVRLIRNHGEACVEGLKVDDISNTLGWNYRMTELEAAVGVVQFRKLDHLTHYRQELAFDLSKKLACFDELVMPETLPDCSHVFFLFSIKYKPAAGGPGRSELVASLNREGIPFGAGYVKPLYLQPIYQKKICFGTSGWPFTSVPESPNYRKGLCPVTERLHESELIHTNVCHYPVTTEDLNDVVKAFDKILCKGTAKGSRS